MDRWGECRRGGEAMECRGKKEFWVEGDEFGGHNGNAKIYECRARLTLRRY